MVSDFKSQRPRSIARFIFFKITTENRADIRANLLFSYLVIFSSLEAISLAAFHPAQWCGEDI